MTEEEKTKWFMLGKQAGREEALAAIRAALGLNECQHCQHKDREHD